MKKCSFHLVCAYTIILFSIPLACNPKQKVSETDIKAMNLKRGEIIFCSPAGDQFGTVSFETSCSKKVQKDFDLAVALLHSFEYDEAEKAFAKIIEAEPGCAMAYWGVALCNYHQVWPELPSQAELDKGDRAIKIAQSITNKSKRETDYINAIALFYNDWKNADHKMRSQRFRKGMEDLYNKYSADKEAAIFYALTLVGTSNPADKSYNDQKKAGKILEGLYPGQPNHPGIVHYIIHSYDYPSLAQLALSAARKYASIAPASAHAQHMPSHIFIRLGLWDESIQSNLTSTESARCYAEGVGIKGNWDEELHGLDYLVYAYLQKGENNLAKKQLDYMAAMPKIYPENFKVAYALAAVPARYYLENKMWKEAAGSSLLHPKLQWQKFSWQKAIFHFARAMGAANSQNLTLARTETTNLQTIYDTLKRQQKDYMANQVLVQLNTTQAWIKLREGKKDEAMQIMQAAVDLEDKTEKSPVTPGEIIPARELLADMQMELHMPVEALQSYEANLSTHPNRFNSLYGAGQASEQVNDNEKAMRFYQLLTQQAKKATDQRPEIKQAKKFLTIHNPR